MLASLECKYSYFDSHLLLQRNCNNRVFIFCLLDIKLTIVRIDYNLSSDKPQ
jgi:hypothetical protein